MSDPVQVAYASALEIDRRFPGLRQQVNFEWIKKVAYLASLSDPRIGHSSSHSDSNPTRRNEVGIREGADVVGGRQTYRAVSLFQINPGAGDPLRPEPLVSVNVDFWFPAVPVDLGGPVVPVPPVVVPPVKPAYPDEGTFWKEFQHRMRSAYVDAGRTFPDPNDADAFRRFSRCGFDIGCGLDAQTAADKHIAELRAELGV